MNSYLITNDNCQLHYRYAVNESKPTLIFANSLGTTMKMWEPQVEYLKQHFSVLNYDMRGHGGSSVMPGAYSIDRLGCDLIELLNHLKLESVFFCGLSIGGMIGQWLATVHPERVTKLVLANTSAHAGPATLWDERLALIAKDGLQSTWPMVRERWVSDEFAEGSPEAVEMLRLMFKGMDEQGYIASCAAVRDMDMRNVAQLNYLPTLLIAGANDIASPLSKSEYLLSQYGNASMTALDAGHLSNIEQSELFNEVVLTFLA